MKKSLAALAVLGTFTTLAYGQSNVTIYGIVDAGVVRESGGTAGSVTNVSSGIGSSSRLGFRGAEDLGNGWSANFVLETGARIDTGAADVAGSLFNRQAYVGLKSASFGALTVGRQYTPYYLALSTVGDPFGAGYAGSAKNLFPAGGSNTRTSNTLNYVSPKVGGGFVAELAYAFGEQSGSSSAGRQIGAALGYSAGKLNARLAHSHRNNDLTAAAGALQTPPAPAANRDIGRNTLLAANYDFGVAKAYLAFASNEGTNSSPLPNTSNPFGGTRPTASTDSRDLLVGATVPWGSNTIMASFIAKDDQTGFKQDARQWALGLSHALSKRTSVYSSYAKISNKRGAGYTVGNNTDIGSGDRALNAGIRHTF
ncbi:MAG: porin [Pseudomonadota bacterium]